MTVTVLLFPLAMKHAKRIERFFYKEPISPGVYRIRWSDQAPDGDDEDEDDDK